MSNNMDEIYHDSAEFGRAWVYYTAIAITVLAVIAIVTGIFYRNTDDTHELKVTGRVATSVCRYIGGVYDCNLAVTYTTPVGEHHVMIRSYEPRDYNPGDEILLLVDQDDINQAKIRSMGNSQFGTNVMSAGILAIAVVWILVWLTERFEFFAAASGTATAINLLV